MTDQDWLNDPRLQAAAFSGSADNRAYSYAERYNLAMKAVGILEDLVRQLDAERAEAARVRVFSLTEIPDDVTQVHDRDKMLWTRGPFGWQPQTRGAAIDADGVRWNYANSRDLVLRFGPITEVVDT